MSTSGVLDQVTNLLPSSGLPFLSHPSTSVAQRSAWMQQLCFNSPAYEWAVHLNEPSFVAPAPRTKSYHVRTLISLLSHLLSSFHSSHWTPDTHAQILRDSLSHCVLFQNFSKLFHIYHINLFQKSIRWLFHPSSISCAHLVLKLKASTIIAYLASIHF